MYLQILYCFYLFRLKFSPLIKNTVLCVMLNRITISKHLSLHKHNTVFKQQTYVAFPLKMCYVTTSKSLSNTTSEVTNNKQTSSTRCSAPIGCNVIFYYPSLELSPPKKSRQFVTPFRSERRTNRQTHTITFIILVRIL